MPIQQAVLSITGQIRTRAHCPTVSQIIPRPRIRKMIALPSSTCPAKANELGLETWRMPTFRSAITSVTFDRERRAKS